MMMSMAIPPVFTQTLTEYTLTYRHKNMECLQLRMEYRHDRSDANAFDGSSGEGTESTAEHPVGERHR